MRPWRLIESPPASGAENMALDEALLESVIAGEGPPTLRFYAWTPATLSIGFNQGEALATGRRLEEVPVPVVRRITGGRAILHDDELTYSVVCREDDALFGGSVWETYLKLSRFLVEGLREIGVDARVAGGAAPASHDYGRPSEGSPSCFSTPTPHEIAVGEAKIAASAQRRVRGALLQHGSVLLGFDPERLARVLG
ncbi:MAG: lipoate--protein ligase family protein, partial [Candidatus Methylomirabilis sp.]|nr:lipoate--protein ligase family protein [Deltaproteobacteria bacterium]